VKKLTIAVIEGVICLRLELPCAEL